MSINARQVEIIRLLLKEDRYLPTTELARAAGCSERTVRNDVHAINAFLAQEGVAVHTESKRGNGIRLAASTAERERIQGAVEERALAVDAGLDRFYRGMLLLTCDYNRRYTTETLARATLTNKQQCQEDLRAWNELFVPFQAKIVRRRYLSVEGREEFIRFFVVYHLYNIASTAMKRRIEPQIFVDEQLRDTRGFLNAEIDAIERALSKPFTDNARHQIAFYLQVMFFRVRQGHVLPDKDEGPGAGDATGTVAGVPAASIPPAFDTLADHMEQRFGIALPQSERTAIYKLFVVSTRRWTPDFQDSYTPDAASAGHAFAVFASLEQRFGRRPPAHLEKPLAELIQAASTHRQLERATSLPRENTRAVRFDNMSSYLRLMEVMRDTQGLRDISFYATDYTRIAMLLLGYLDGVAVHDLWRVGLVVNCGIEQVFYARDRIERLIPCTRIARVLTEQELLEDSAGVMRDLDFLVSFDPMETDAPAAVISSAIGEADRQRISNVIMQLGCPGSGDAETPLAGGFPQRELACDSSQPFSRVLHQALVDDGLWKGPLADFATALEMNALTTEGWMLLTAFSNDVRATGVARYEVDAEVGFSGKRLRHVLALTVARKDERVLTPLTQAFRRMAIEAGFPAR